MPDADRSLVDAIRRGLAEVGDPAVGGHQQAYMKSAMPYRGVTMPVMRRLVRPLLDAHPLATRAVWESTIRELWDHASYREERYAATVLARHRRYREHQDPTALPLYDHLIVTGAWWDHVDEIAIHLVGPILRSHPDDVTPILRAWAADDNLWRRRTAIIAQIGSKAATDTELLRHAIDLNCGDPDFFVRKAIGWALREYAKTDDQWVRHLLAEYGNRLSPLSRREAAKHL